MGTYFPVNQSGVQTGLTADSGSVQAGATLCNGGVNIVAVSAIAGDSCILPVNIPQYARVVVANQGVASLDLFPNVGATINAGAADAALAVANGTTVELMQIGVVGDAWLVV